MFKYSTFQQFWVDIRKVFPRRGVPPTEHGSMQTFPAPPEGFEIPVPLPDEHVRERDASDHNESSGHFLQMTRTLDHLLTALSEGRRPPEGSYKALPGEYGRLVDTTAACVETIYGRIQQIDAIMLTMASGDLTCRITADAPGAWESLYENINRSIANVHIMLRNVGRTVTATSASVEQICMAVRHLTLGSQEQVLQAADVAEGVGEMTRAARDSSYGAQLTTQAAVRTGDIAHDGQKIVSQTIARIRQIADVTSTSAQSVENLGVSSEQIGNIVQVIADIASQTNLLALNAAIEAARAGVQGQGFAVVADEVRRLADRTAAATKEISKLISSIQSETEFAVNTMRGSSIEVEAGLCLADQAGAALQQIVSNVDQTIDLVHQIAAASEQQSVTTEQIARSIQMIAAVSNESLQGNELIVKSTEDLSALIQSLLRTVNRFNTEQAAVPETTLVAQ